jgi:hypothetical protein
MDDFNLKKLKVIINFIEFYKGFFFISSLATLVICILIKILQEEDTFYIQGFIENWDKKPIIDMKFSRTECPKDYELTTLGNWPIYSNICDCRDSFFYNMGAKSDRALFKPYSCNWMMNMLGCKDSDKFSHIKINEWKGKKVCIKRQEKTFLQTLLSKVNSNTADINLVNCENCELKDSLNKKICNEECALTNKDVNNFAVSSYNRKKEIKFNYRWKDSKIRSPLNRFLPDYFKVHDNFTTYQGLEMVYNKNFNITLNNKIIEDYSISDVFIGEHYPCLIHNTIKKLNVVSNLYDFVLENLQFVVPKERDEFIKKRREDTTVIENPDEKNIDVNNPNEKNSNGNQNDKISTKNHNNHDDTSENNNIESSTKDPNTNNEDQNKTQSLYKLTHFDEISLNYLDKKDCYFYENSYFDRRHNIVDISNFYQFLLSDINKNDRIFFKNLTLTYEDLSRSERFTPTTTIFLLSSPFYGWNIKLCNENPKTRMQEIISLYDSTSTNFTLIALFKSICFIYLTFYGLFYGYFENYIFSLDSPKEKKGSNSYLPIVLDMLYYFFNIVSFCLLIQTAFTLKHLTRFHYLNIIRKDCVDENSTKIFTYVYDISEEKFIYCMFLVALNLMEFIFFTIILNQGYEFLKKINF